MSANRKKTKPFSVSNIDQRVTKPAKRSRSAEKASSSRDPSLQSNPELDTVSDGHSVPSDLTMVTTAHNSYPTVTASTSNSENTVTAEGFMVMTFLYLKVSFVILFTLKIHCLF